MKIRYEMTGDLAKAIRAIKAGKKVVLTEQDVPVALIQPLRAASKEEERAIRGMIDSGLLQPTNKSGKVREWIWRPARAKAA
jgi:antitoxin (DNA-binding transcriptional repressor) of toxin-antitoxin stability system